MSEILRYPSSRMPQWQVKASKKSNVVLERQIPIYGSGSLPILNPISFLIKGSRTCVIQKLHGKSPIEDISLRK